jgi:hypothetical protein
MYENVCSQHGYKSATIYILCINKLLKESERRFKGLECLKCTVSFVTNPFQERDIREC